MKQTLNFALVLSFLLTACSSTIETPLVPTGTPIPLKPTLTETFTPVPSETPTETPIPPLESQPVTQEIVSQFASAMQKAGINITAEQILQQGLLIQNIAGADGKQYEIATTHIDPDPNQKGESLEGDYPLVVKEVDEQKWSAVSLKIMAKIIGINVGTEASGWLFGDKTAFNLAIEQVNKATISDVSWKTLQPTKNSPINFEGLDRQISLWAGTGVQLQGLSLVFPTSTYSMPNWLMNGSFNKQELSEILTNYITQVVTHGKEQGIHEWIVVNEPYLPKYRENDVFYKTFGDYSYIQLAFEAARKADPSATLIFNDTDNHGQGGLTTALTKKIVLDLKKDGLIDAVGIQAHMGDWVKVPDVNDLSKTLKSYEITIIVTEFDYNLTKIEGDESTRNKQQAIVYSNLVRAFLEMAVKNITFWGLDDKNSWLEINHISPNANPTMFDRQFKPKFAYYSTLKAMLDFIH